MRAKKVCVPQMGHSFLALDSKFDFSPEEIFVGFGWGGWFGLGGMGRVLLNNAASPGAGGGGWRGGLTPRTPPPPRPLP